MGGCMGMGMNMGGPSMQPNQMGGMGQNQMGMGMGMQQGQGGFPQQQNFGGMGGGYMGAMSGAGMAPQQQQGFQAFQGAAPLQQQPQQGFQAFQAGASFGQPQFQQPAASGFTMPSAGRGNSGASNNVDDLMSQFGNMALK